MAQKAKFDWMDKNRLKHRAWESVKEFFGKEEEERPLSPGLVAGEIQESSESGSQEEVISHEDRVHRTTEQRRINESPVTTWPG